MMCCAAQEELEEKSRGQGQVMMTAGQQAEWARLQAFCTAHIQLSSHCHT